jgi:hypothetical protein
VGQSEGIELIDDHRQIGDRYVEELSEKFRVPRLRGLQYRWSFRWIKEAVSQLASVLIDPLTIVRPSATHKFLQMTDSYRNSVRVDVIPAEPQFDASRDAQVVEASGLAADRQSLTHWRVLPVAHFPTEVLLPTAEPGLEGAPRSTPASASCPSSELPSGLARPLTSPRIPWFG